MNNSFLASFAVSHFAARPRQPLLAALASRIDEANLISALSSGCPPLQHLAWRHLTDLPEHRRISLFLTWLNCDIDKSAPSILAVLKGLTDPSVELPEEIIGKLVLLMDSDQSPVRHAAASAIAIQRPTAALPLLQRGDLIDPEVLRRLCVADETALIMPIVTAFKFPTRMPPPTIGFLVTPEWLSAHFDDQPEIVKWLIKNCGYCDDDVTPPVLDLLSTGFSYVTAIMSDDPRASKIAHRWQRRIRAFVWRLLPDELELQHDDDKPFDTDSSLERDLFVAAVRDSDRMAFAEQKRLKPFSRACTKREPSPICFHASSHYIRRMFIDESLVWAEKWKIPHERKGDFLIERARVQLEPNSEARLAGELALRGRWQAMSNVSHFPAARTARRPHNQAAPRRLVLGDFKPRAFDDRLSPGANSVLALADVSGLDADAVANWLSEAESRWSKYLVPLGIEVQIPKTDPDRFAAWKDALPFLGVPSPIRPEFGTTLEAAFRPAKSFHAMILGPLLLCRLGLMAEPQEMALHLSLQGDISEDIRSIAFPYHFIHASDRIQNRPPRTMSRVMSKGFVHIHDDAETIDHPPASTQRTELRLFRIVAETKPTQTGGEGVQTPLPPTIDGCGPENSIELSRGFISDVVSVHMLGSALASHCDRCRELFAIYATAVEQATQALPPEFHRLLSSNYLESTGDPTDEGLLALLPIFRHWAAVRELVKAQDLSSSLDRQFRTIRNRHVRSLLEHWKDDHALHVAEITFVDDEMELAIPSFSD